VVAEGLQRLQTLVMMVLLLLETVALVKEELAVLEAR
jgi:hypothetical protein